ncbi:MAG TPA: DNA polymerase III subunit delta [Patescibacteria group bacterium]|nr:DNA polymerase III subunit delta [Patescibacteria group bacterium]
MVIFLYGEDDFRSRAKLLEIRQKYLESDKSGSGLSCFDFDEKAKVEDMISVFGMPNLLAPKRLVIVKNIIFAGLLDAQKKMAEYLKRNKNIFSDKDLVVVFWEKDSLKKNNSLFKILSGSKDVKKQEFGRLSGIKINQWALQKLKEIDEKSAISKTALEKLVISCGSDSAILNGEIQKLISYADGRMITERDVELLTKSKIEGNIFSAIDALGENNKRSAMKLLHDNIEKGEDPFYIFSMIVYQFRNMLKIADLKERGMGSEYEISRMIKMHPFVIRKTLAQTSVFTFERLKKIYGKLMRFDMAVKTGKIDMNLALDRFVAEV